MSLEILDPEGYKYNLGLYVNEESDTGDIVEFNFYKENDTVEPAPVTDSQVGTRVQDVLDMLIHSMEVKSKAFDTGECTWEFDYNRVKDVLTLAKRLIYE